MVLDTDLDACAESIIQMERHATQLTKYGKELDRLSLALGSAALSDASFANLSYKIESEAEAGRYLTENTGEFLKVQRLIQNTTIIVVSISKLVLHVFLQNNLRNNLTDRLIRLRLDKLARQVDDV